MLVALRKILDLCFWAGLSKTMSSGHTEPPVTKGCKHFSTIKLNGLLNLPIKDKS
jgi:hypothetical protein